MRRSFQTPITNATPTALKKIGLIEGLAALLGAFIGAQITRRNK
jgi:hypothetical protein